MAAPGMRTWMEIVEATSTYTLVRYDAPNSGRIVDQTQVRARNGVELKQAIRAWMDQQGLDPDDEDARDVTLSATGRSWALRWERIEASVEAFAC